MKGVGKIFLVLFVLLAFLRTPAMVSAPAGQEEELIKRCVAAIVTAGGSTGVEAVKDITELIELLEQAEQTNKKNIDALITYYENLMLETLSKVTNDYTGAWARLNSNMSEANSIASTFSLDQGSSKLPRQAALDALKLGAEKIGVCLSVAKKYDPRAQALITELSGIEQKAIQEANAYGTEALKEYFEDVDYQEEVLKNILSIGTTALDPTYHMYSTVMEGLRIADEEFEKKWTHITSYLEREYFAFLAKAAELAKLGPTNSAPLAHIVGCANLSDTVIEKMKNVAALPNPVNITALQDVCNFSYWDEKGMIVTIEYLPDRGPTPPAPHNTIQSWSAGIEQRWERPFALPDRVERDLDTAFVELFAGKSAAEVSQNKAAIMNKVREGLKQYPFMIPKIEQYLSRQANKWASKPGLTTPLQQEGAPAAAQKVTTAIKATEPVKSRVQKAPMTSLVKPGVTSVTLRKAVLAQGGDRVVVEAKGTNLEAVASARVERTGKAVPEVEATVDKSLLPATLKISLKSSSSSPIAADYQLALFDANNKKLLDIPTAVLAIEVQAPAQKARTIQKAATPVKAVEPIRTQVQKERMTSLAKPSVTSVTPQKAVLSRGGDAVVVEARGNNLGEVGSVQVTRGGVGVQSIKAVLEKSQLPTVLKVTLKASPEALIANDFQLTFFDAMNKKLLGVSASALAIEVIGPAEKAIMAEKPTTAIKSAEPVQSKIQAAPISAMGKPSVASANPQKAALSPGGGDVVVEIKGTNLEGVGSVRVIRGGAEAQGIKGVLDKSQLPAVLKVSLKASPEALMASDIQLAFFDAANKKLLEVPIAVFTIEVVAPSKKAVVLKKVS